MNGQRFDIVPPGKLARVLPIVMAVLPPVMVLATMALASRGRHEAVPMEAIVGALLVFPLIGGALAWSIHRRAIHLIGGRLVIGRLLWRRIAVNAFDLDAARIVDLAAQRELQPVMKIAGSGLPGYKSGLFRLRNKVRAQVLLTDWKRVLVLPKRDGGMVLLSPQRPDALLAALRQLSAASR
jgi:hypothetical protein